MNTCCWEWQGATNRDGYGRFKNGRKLERAHAMLLWWSTGNKPSYIMHICDNPCCVRPSHLQEGTPTLNIIDAYKKGRRPDCTPKATSHYKSRFTTEDIISIRTRYALGETQKSIGDSYGVTGSHISQIIKGKLYSSIPLAEAKVGNSWQEAK